MAGWSEAPPDLLWLIIERLLFADWVRFASVCTLWRAALAEKRRPLSPDIPWLLIPGGDTATGCLRFFSYSDRREYRIQAPDQFARWRHKYIGSSEGWLITMDEFGETHMFNPISQTHVRLPSISITLPNMYFRRLENSFQVSFSKVIISVSPSASSSSFTAAAICPWNNLAFVREEDTSWNIVNMPENIVGFHDILFCRKQLYALTYDGAVVAIDLSDPSHPVVTFAFVSPPVSHPCVTLNKYLVELSGDLFQVWRVFNYEPVRVFKMNQDKDGRKWIEVKSIGDNAFFLGQNDPITVPPTILASNQRQQCAQELKGNRVYFTVDQSFQRAYFDIEIFNLEGGFFIECIRRIESQHYPPSLIWFTPRLNPTLSR